MPKKYDLIVIGSGPGGEGAALKAAKEGKNVAIVDDFSKILQLHNPPNCK